MILSDKYVKFVQGLSENINAPNQRLFFHCAGHSACFQINPDEKDKKGGSAWIRA